MGLWLGSKASEYKATLADNYGRAAVLHGHIDGDRMVFTSTGNEPPFLKLTWELLSDGNILWHNELSVDGDSWMLVEDYVITPGN